MCGDSHLPAAPESNDLVAIIHPIARPAAAAAASTPSLSRTNSTSSTASVCSSFNTSPEFVQGRLRLSNSHADGTLLDLSHYDASLSALYGSLSVRIHKYGSSLQTSGKGWANPVLLELPVGLAGQASSGTRLDLGVGENGVVGRTVSIVDGDSRLLGEGIIGRI